MCDRYHHVMWIWWSKTQVISLLWLWWSNVFHTRDSFFGRYHCTTINHPNISAYESSALRGKLFGVVHSYGCQFDMQTSNLFGNRANCSNWQLFAHDEKVCISTGDHDIIFYVCHVISILMYFVCLPKEARTHKCVVSLHFISTTLNYLYYMLDYYVDYLHAYMLVCVPTTWCYANTLPIYGKGFYTQCFIVRSIFVGTTPLSIY